MIPCNVSKEEASFSAWNKRLTSLTHRGIGALTQLTPLPQRIHQRSVVRIQNTVGRGLIDSESKRRRDAFKKEVIERRRAPRLSPSLARSYLRLISTVILSFYQKNAQM